eukprot:COSAG04_NODE_80_length_28110_cov_13.522847_7_plen_90_part_00
MAAAPPGPFPEALLRMGFPEWKARIAWDRKGDVNLAGDYLLNHGHEPDSFWRPVSPAPAPARSGDAAQAGSLLERARAGLDGGGGALLQ